MKNTVRAHECVLFHSWQSTEGLELRPVPPGGRCVGFPPPFSCAEVPKAPSLGKSDPRGIGGPGERGHLLSWPWWLVCQETQLSESSSRGCSCRYGENQGEDGVWVGGAFWRNEGWWLCVRGCVGMEPRWGGGVCTACACGTSVGARLLSQFAF